MLKRPLLALGMTLSLLAPAWAEIDIDHLVARVKPSGVEYSVTLHNPGDTVQQGPIQVKLFSRAPGHDKWNQVTSWNIEVIPAGGGVTKDFASGDNAADAGKRDWDCKVVVSYPGDEGPEESHEYADIIRLK